MDRETAEEIKRHFDVVAEGLRSEMHELAGGLRVVDEGLRSEMHELAGGLQREIRAVDGKVDRISVDLKPHFEVLGESLRSDIRLVAEGVAGLDEKFTQEFVNVRTEIREQIGDVKALIRGGYADLDRGK